jgi:hypothetical protein
MIFMKKGLQRIQSTLIIFTALLLAVYPAYFQYNDIIEIDFLSPHHSFENPDQENLLVDKVNKTKIFVPSFSPAISFACFFSLAHLPDLSLQIFCLDKPTSVLRC